MPSRRLAELRVGCARLAKRKRSVYQFRVIYSRNSARSCWRFSPQAHWLEYQDWAARILERPLELKDGFALPQKQAGLGLTWDKDAVERYRVC
jgi:hypothetical protein